MAQSSTSIGTPRLLGAARRRARRGCGRNLFRWIPPDQRGGAGKLLPYPTTRPTVWGTGRHAFDTYLAPHSADLFNLYVVDPAVIRSCLSATSDGGVFLAPQNTVVQHRGRQHLPQLYIDVTSRPDRDNVVSTAAAGASFKLQTRRRRRPATGHDYRYFDGPATPALASCTSTTPSGSASWSSARRTASTSHSGAQLVPHRP